MTRKTLEKIVADAKFRRPDLTADLDEIAQKISYMKSDAAVVQALGRAIEKVLASDDPPGQIKILKKSAWSEDEALLVLKGALVKLVAVLAVVFGVVFLFFLR